MSFHLSLSPTSSSSLTRFRPVVMPYKVKPALFKSFSTLSIHRCYFQRVSRGDSSSLLAIEDDPLVALDDASADKRAHVFRYGKRAPSVFRYGKRAPSVFRYGKRLFDEGGAADSSLLPKRIFRPRQTRGSRKRAGGEGVDDVPREEGGGVRGVAEGEEEETLLIKGSDDIDAITVDKKPIFRYG